MKYYWTQDEIPWTEWLFNTWPFLQRLWQLTSGFEWDLELV